MRKRNRHVSVWMNEAEYLHLKAEAKKAGLGIDPFIRLLVSGVQLRPRPPDNIAALIRELHAIGNNINQIAYWANAQKSTQEEDLRRAAALAYEAARLVKENSVKVGIDPGQMKKGAQNRPCQHRSFQGKMDG